MSLLRQVKAKRESKRFHAKAASRVKATPYFEENSSSGRAAWDFYDIARIVGNIIQTTELDILISSSFSSLI